MTKMLELHWLKDGFVYFVLISTIFLTGYNERVYSASIPKAVSRPLVRFNFNGTFKIVLFTDLHYGFPDPTSRKNDIKTTKIITDILEWENPDFVVFTGDLVHGDLMIQNVTQYIVQMLQPLVKKGIRWASTYGNHDTGPFVSRLDILRTEQSFKELCYTQQMTASELSGVTNYYIPIYPPASSNTSEKPVFLLWFLDSRGGFTVTEMRPFFIDKEAVEWFSNESKALKEKWGPLPSLVFFHIAAAEYATVQTNFVRIPRCSGLVGEEVTQQYNDTGIINALLNAGGVRTVFVGHDHENSWCCFYKTIELCYNRKTGYNSYGAWTRGGRVITLDINNLLRQTNYVRLESGEIIDRFPGAKHG